MKGAPAIEEANVMVVAEIGVNHDGSAAKAKKLLAAAKEAGADAVKLQIFQAARLMHASGGFAEYQKERVADASAAEMLRRYELDESVARDLAREAKGLDLKLIATPFSPGDLPLIEALGLAAVKIASPDLVNKPLLRGAARLGKPLLVSTGAATMEEVGRTVGWLKEWKVSFTLLHCVSAYPTPVEAANLCWIGELAARFGMPVGYSDHTTEIGAGGLAVAAGAKVIEKHLTLDQTDAGPDHEASLEPRQFADYVKQIRLAQRMVGKPGKRALEIESDVRRMSRQSLVLARPVGAGAVVKEEDLTVQRPGTGVGAWEIDEFLGRRARRDLRAGEMADWDMLA